MPYSQMRSEWNKINFHPIVSALITPYVYPHGMVRKGSKWLFTKEHAVKLKNEDQTPWI